MGFMVKLKSLPLTHLSPLLCFEATRNNFETTCSITNCSDDRMPFASRDSSGALAWMRNACKYLSIHHGSCLSAISSLPPNPFSSFSPLSWAPCLCPSFLRPPRDAPFSKVWASEPFAPSLLHYAVLSFLSLALSLRGGLQWVFITQQVNLHHGVLCVLSLAQRRIVAHTGVRRLHPPVSSEGKYVYTLCS